MTNLIKFVLFAIVLITGSITAQTAVAPAGSGTAEDPYRIETLENLYWINTNSDNFMKHYIQTADIDASETHNWPSGWIPIGSGSVFMGYYNGDNHIIKNLLIVSSSTSVGLFNAVLQGTVLNLGIENCSIISAGVYTGALAGSANNSTISNCYSTGNISFGGVFVSGGFYGGGLIGIANLSSISNSYSLASVTGNHTNNNSGGFIGYADDCAIEKCYSAGEVSTTTFAGGFLSTAANQQNTITACFYDTEASTRSVSGGGTGRTTVQMKTKTNYTNAGWDFTDEEVNGTDDIWFINSTLQQGYPALDRLHKLPTVSFSSMIIYADSASFLLNLYTGISQVSEFGYELSWTEGVNNMNTTIYLGSTDTSGIFSHKLTGLIPEKAYTIRAFATNQKGTYNNNYDYFTTYPINPVPPAGSGTSNDPYLISSLENILWISLSASNYSKHYKQTADIDASATAGWYQGEGWDPIGSGSQEFTGTYDGQGFKINALTINRPYTEYIGFIAYLTGTVKNLGFTNASVTGRQFTGIIAGILENGNILNCYTTGSVTVSLSNAGGFAGYMSSCTVSDSYNRATITGTSYLGGIAGVGYNNTIIRCYGTGRIIGSGSNKGGIIGGTWGGTVVDNSFFDSNTIGILPNSYGTGRTTEQMKTQSTFTSALWDFAGESANGNNDHWILLSDRNDGYPTLSITIAPPAISTDAVTSITSSQATLNANVTSIGGAPLYSHGFCWNTTGTPTVSDNKIDLGVRSVTGSISYTFSGLDGGITYYVRAFAINGGVVAYGDPVSFSTPIGSAAPSGSGTAEDPYLISSIDNLYWLTNNPSAWNKQFRQTANIRASATRYWNSGAGWQPIGTSSPYFTGVYDGNGYAIDSLNINRPSTVVIGLFGYVIGGTLKNLGLTNVNVTGLDFTGALCGYGEPITVTNCYSKGTVNGRNSVGGLIGHMAINSTVSKCYTTGSVTGNDRVGGILGRFYYNSVMNNSYSRASVTGVNRVGGLAPGNEVATTTNCYSTGAVTGITNTGALFGFNSGTINNSFFDSQTANQGANSGGGTGATTIQMKTTSTFTDAGWDFTGESTNGSSDIWKMDPLYNDGYPILSTQRFFNTVFSVGIPANSSLTYSSSNIHFATQGSGTVTFNFTESNSTPPNLPGGSVTIGKYWEISDITGGTVKIRLYYEPSLTASFSGAPKIYHYNGSYWEDLPTGPEVTEGSLKYVETLDYYGSFSPVTVGDEDSPLPVELKSFSVKITGGKAILNWHTVTEVQNYGFDIERKAPGEKEFNKIGFVEGSGNSNTEHKYTFADNGISTSGKYIYRLKQIDTDGSYSYSDNAESEYQGPAQFALDQNYPNPFNPSTIIRFSLPEDSRVKIVVYDLLGSLVEVLVDEERSAGRYSVTFEPEGLASGTYIYSITAGSFKAVKKMTLLR